MLRKIKTCKTLGSILLVFEQKTPPPKDRPTVWWVIGLFCWFFISVTSCIEGNPFCVPHYFPLRAGPLEQSAGSLMKIKTRLDIS